jgi:hypothetical protein
MANGTTHSLDVSYTPYHQDRQIKSDAIFFALKTLWMKKIGISKFCGIFAGYCSVSWSE